LLAFIHIHKTAGTTIQWILRSTFGLNHCELIPWHRIPKNYLPWQVYASSDDLKRTSRFYPNLESIGSHFVQAHSDLEVYCPSITYFTFLRDPLKHRASMFQHGVFAHRQDNLNLEDWLAEEQSSNRQTKMIAGSADVNAAIRMIQTKGIFVGLTDNFDESIFLFKSLFETKLNILYRPMRVSLGNTSYNLLTSEKKCQMLSEGNEADIQLYNYVKREIYPNYQREYGDNLYDHVLQYRTELAPYQEQIVSLPSLEKWSFKKAKLLLQLKPYNQKNVVLSIIKTNVIYRMVIYFHRKKLRESDK
jgi:hypothetical protein